MKRYAAAGLILAAALAAALLLREGDDRRARISAVQKEPPEPEVPAPEAVAEEAGEPEIPPGPCRPIEGVVRSREDGAPLCGASVTPLLHLGPRPVEFGRGRVRTDAEGRFRIDLPVAGEEASLLVAAQGFVEEEFACEGSPIEILLSRECALFGLALDEAGRPVPLAEVMLVPADLPALLDLPREALRDRARAATSDGEGRYRIPCLPPGEFFWVLAFAEGFARAPLPGRVRAEGIETRKDVTLSPEQGILLRLLLPEGVAPSSANWSIAPAAHRNRPAAGPDGRWFWPTGAGEFAVRVVIASWPSASAAFVVERGKVREGEIRVDGGVAIEGVVVDDEDHPVPGARLHGRPRDGEPGDARSAFCDGWGRFRLEGAARGPWVLEVRVRAGSGWAASAAECVAPAAGARIRVVRPTLLRYRVDPDSAGGVQANVLSDGRIVAGFPRRPGGAVEEILTRTGRFSLLVDAGDAVAGPVEFDATPGGVVDLGPLPLSTGSPVVVAVTDRAGLPVGGAQVGCSALAQRFARPLAGIPGSYGFESLPTGPIRIWASAAGYRRGELLLPEGSREARLALERSTSLLVRVADRTGRAVRRVEVAVLAALPPSPEPLRLTRITGDGGVAAFDLPPGDFRVEVRSGKFGPVEERIRLAEGESRHLDVTVDPR